MPSMADEVATERCTLDRRTAGSRIKGLALESLELMDAFCHLWGCSGEWLE